MTWFTDNIGTIGTSLVLTGIVALVAMKLIRDKKRGKSSCGCGCASCAMAGKCHENAKM